MYTSPKWMWYGLALIALVALISTVVPPFILVVLAAVGLGVLIGIFSDDKGDWV